MSTCVFELLLLLAARFQPQTRTDTLLRPAVSEERVVLRTDCGDDKAVTVCLNWTNSCDMAAAKKSGAKSGGVRFSEEPPAAGAASHVHFDEKLHDSVVMVTPQDDGNFMVKVGFLKTQHRYEIVFTLPEVPALGKDVCPAPLPSPHLRITDITPAPEGGLKITCEYMAQQEGVLCEEVLLLSETNEDVCVKVKVHARVMDRHHGTPMLLEGVRCIGMELEYDSEQSDWQGFD